MNEVTALLSQRPALWVRYSFGLCVLEPERRCKDLFSMMLMVGYLHLTGFSSGSPRRPSRG